MTETQLIEEIIRNFGDKAPWLLVLWMFMKFLWPDVRDLIKAYLEGRDTSHSNDPLTQLSSRMDTLVSTTAGLSSSLTSFISESRTIANQQQTAWAEMSRMVAVTVGLVREINTSVPSLPGRASTPPPVSPEREGIDGQGGKSEAVPLHERLPDTPAFGPVLELGVLRGPVS